MIIPALILLSAQNATVPVIPPGLNKEFVAVCYSIENDLAAGDFDGAEKLSELLPKPQATLRLDDSSLAEQRRSEFRRQLDVVIDQVKPVMDLKETSGEADIVVSFAKRVDPDPNAPLPKAADLTFGSTKPRVGMRIALTRTGSPTPVTENDVHNEIAYAVAEYLGLQQIPRFGTFSSRTDQSTNMSVGLDTEEQRLALLALDISKQFRQLIAAKQKITPAAPSLEVSTNAISGVRGVQDMPLQIGLKVTNKGNADLLMYVLPDCGCLRPAYPTILKPNQSGPIVSDVNTALYHSGNMEHSLLIYSNDPTRPMLKIPVKMYVAPLFRFAKPGPPVVALTPEGADFDVYLAIAEQAKVSVLTASLTGARGTVQTSTWAGALPEDSDSSEQTSHGYKFHIHVDPGAPYGQSRGSLFLGTDSEAFRELTYDFTLQRGMVAEPGQLYFGTTPPEPRDFYFVVSDPSRSFKITSIDSGSPNLTAKAVPANGGKEYRINVSFDGHVEYGAFAAVITIHTDNPKQPVIRVPVSGRIQ